MVTWWAASRPIVILGLMVSIGWAAAQAGEATEFVWTPATVVDDLPQQVAPGYTRFTLESEGTSDSLTIFRLNEDVTLDEFAAVSRRIDQAFGEGGDVVEALNEGLALVDVIAEASAEPGERQTVGAVLEEGRYVLEHGTFGPEGPGERTYHEFTVEGERGAEPPMPDATVQFVDFAFAIPPDLGAGEQTWHVINRGQQLHHMVIFRLAEGATVDDFMSWMEEMEREGPPESDAPPVAEPAGHVGIMSSGQESYHVIDLEAGEYVAVCFLPDHRGDATGQPHFMLGMLQAFSVAE